MSYFDFLHLLCASELCHDHNNQCTLWRNFVQWPSQDTARRELASGDYIILQIRSLPGRDACTLQDGIHAQEIADARRFLYIASPPDSDDEGSISEPDAEEDHSVEEHPSETTEEGVRSRSRSIEACHFCRNMLPSWPADLPLLTSPTLNRVRSSNPLRYPMSLTAGVYRLGLPRPYPVSYIPERPPLLCASMHFQDLKYLQSLSCRPITALKPYWASLHTGDTVIYGASHCSLRETFLDT